VCAGEDRLEVVARDFRVTNSRQELLFAANRKEVVVGADILRVSGEIGQSFFFNYFFSNPWPRAYSHLARLEPICAQARTSTFWRSFCSLRDIMRIIEWQCFIECLTRLKVVDVNAPISTAQTSSK
jgi:hypothetical protein